MTQAALDTTSVRRWKQYAEYRPSEAPWVIEWPARWQEKRLKYLVTPSRRRFLEKPEDATYIGLEQIESKTGKLLLDNSVETVESNMGVFEPGDLLFGKLRPYLAKVAAPPFAGVCSTELTVYRPNPQINSNYLKYQLLSTGFISFVNTLAYGTKMPRVSEEQMGEMRIAVPPLPEQRAIAAFLDRETARIDALIARKERLIELLEEKRQAVITRSVTRGIDASPTLRDFNVRGLPPIPDHWQSIPVWVLFELGRGRVISHEEIHANSGEYPVFSSQTENDGILGHIDTFEFDGDYLTWTTDGAKAGTVFARSGRFNCTNVCGTMKIRDRRQVLDYFAYALNLITPHYVRHDINPKLMNNVMAGIRLPLPPHVEQQQIVEAVERETIAVRRLVSRIKRGIERLQEYRSALISAAVTGQIDVREEVMLND